MIKKIKKMIFNANKLLTKNTAILVHKYIVHVVQAEIKPETP